MSASARDSRLWAGLGSAVAIVGACLVCCAAPIVSVLGGIAAVWIPALTVLAVLAAGTALWARPAVVSHSAPATLV